MAYRDDAAAARARLVALELELAARKVARPTLERYRNALRGELQRLAHALVWYQNGERFGFNRFQVRDDLAPAQPEPLPLPGAEQMAEALATVEPAEAVARAQAVSRALEHADPALALLRGEVEGLREQCARLRAIVDAYAQRYPHHPPPPEYRPGLAWVAAVIGVSGGYIAMIVWLLF
jgi:hypothetical protein